MITKTDYQCINALLGSYTPETRGIVSDDEAALIRSTLLLKERSNVELQNARDMAVLIYGANAEARRQSGDLPGSMTLMDAVSAVTCIIDMEKYSRGAAV